MVESLLTRREALITASAAVAATALPVRRARAQSLDKISMLNGWVAEPEQGGFYQALAMGIYRDHGLDASIRNGGPQLNASSLLINGRVDTISADSFTALAYVAQNLPFLCVAAY